MLGNVRTQHVIWICLYHNTIALALNTFYCITWFGQHFSSIVGLIQTLIGGRTSSQLSMCQMTTKWQRQFNNLAPHPAWWQQSIQKIPVVGSANKGLVWVTNMTQYVSSWDFQALGSMLWSTVESLLLGTQRKHFYQAEEAKIRLCLGAKDCTLGQCLQWAISAQFLLCLFPQYSQNHTTRFL